MSDTSITRRRRPSLRAMLTLGGAAVMVGGAVAGTDTLAATTDSATAAVSQIATQNFFPTPLTASVTCTTNQPGTITTARAVISWDAVPGATGYRMELVRRSNGTVKSAEDVGAGTTSIGGISDSGREGLYARVYTKNGDAISSGYRVSNTGMSFKDWVSGRTQCEGSTGTNLPNQEWEDQSEWTPAVAQALAKSGKAMANPFVPEAVEAADETEASEAPESTEAPEPSESTEPEAPAESTAPESSTPPSSSSPAPAPSTSTPAEPKVTIGIGVSGSEKVLLISHDGEEVCYTPLGEGDEPSINGNTVVISNGNTVKTVNTDTCAVS